jgi:hypothetical protein
MPAHLQAWRHHSHALQRLVFVCVRGNASLQHVSDVSMQALGGEDILLDEFANLGLHCDPLTQLVVTCEVRVQLFAMCTCVCMQKNMGEHTAVHYV